MPLRSCSVCSKRVYGSQRGIFCNCCNHWVHLKCSKFSYKEYISLSNDDSDWYCHLCIMEILPFNKLEEFEFQLVLAEFAMGPTKLGFKSLDEFHINPFTLNNINTNKVIDEDSDPDVNFYNHTKNEDNYYSDNELNKVLKDLGINHSKNHFSLMHLNARSINKNIEAINQMLSSLEISFDLIGISETWIPEGNDLIQMENYKFLCNGRKYRKGGGIGIYLKEAFNYKLRKDLSIFDEDIMESLFIELVSEENTNIIVGVIYRAPDSDVKSFLKSFSEITEKLNLENKNCYLLGDFNINLLSVNDSYIAGEFLDIIYSSFFKPLISKHTRITTNTATLIDNIFTNVFDDKATCVNGLVCAEISDHIPIFHIHKTKDEQNKQKKEAKFIRRYDKNSLETFKNKLDCIDWNETTYNVDPNIVYDNFIKKFSEIHNSCFPLKKVKSKNKRIKPWISKGMLISIKRKNLLYKSYIRSPNITNKTKFTIYRNKLNHLLRLSKKQYINIKIQDSENKMKETWKILNSLLNKSKGRGNYPSYVLDNIIKDTDSLTIANKFCNYFSKIGSNLAKKNSFNRYKL